MKKLIPLFFLFVVASCGKDQLNSSLKKGTASLSASKECTFNNLGPPVCGLLPKDNSLHDYFNREYAECLGAQVQFEGHCQCETNTVSVCASDGVSYSECDAKAKKLTIVKYTPCEVKDL